MPPGSTICVSVVRVGYPGSSVVKNPPANAGDMDLIPGREDPLEEEMAAHSSVLAWMIPWTEEPGGLPSVRSQSRARLRTTHMHVDGARLRTTHTHVDGGGAFPPQSLMTPTPGLPVKTGISTDPEARFAGPQCQKAELSASRCRQS